DGHGAFAVQQQHGYRLADDVGLADDDNVLALQVIHNRIKQLDHAERGAGHDTAGAGVQTAHVYRVEPVNVLVRADGLQHFARVDRLWHRHLAQQAVHFRVVVQFFDYGQHFVLRRGGRKAAFDRTDANLFAGLDLAAYVD